MSALPQASVRADGSALVIRIHPNDDVVIARGQLVGGTRIESEGITVSGLIPPGHKIATRALRAGDPVRRYDQIIGNAKQAIAPGQHVHTHNLEFSTFARDYAATSGARPTDYAPERATFDGIVRADGRVATRNYIGILTSVNCSATVAQPAPSWWSASAARPTRSTACSSRRA
jgi:altronate hydrolase